MDEQYWVEALRKESTDDARLEILKSIAHGAAKEEREKCNAIVKQAWGDKADINAWEQLATANRKLEVAMKALEAVTHNAPTEEFKAFDEMYGGPVSSGNYDDCVYDGMREKHYKLAQVARAAITTITEMGD